MGVEHGLDRRRFERTHLERACKVLLERKARLVRAETLDLSDGGARLRIGDGWRPGVGESVAVWIERGDVGVQRSDLGALSRVAWADGDEVGIEFEAQRTGMAARHADTGARAA